MKPVFGIDISHDKKNENLNGKEFIVATASKKMEEDLEAKQKEIAETVRQSKLPLWIRIAKMICGVGGIILAISTVKAAASIGFSKAFRDSSMLIFLSFGLLIGWAILQFLSNKKERMVFEERNAMQQADSIEKDIQSIYDSLGVPSDADSVDILAFRYKLKDGIPSARTVGLQLTPYLNLDLKIYQKNDELCVADLENVYSFKKSELRSIKTISKRISIPSWNKEEHPTKGIYKPYKMTINNMGCIFFKPYYILEIEHEQEIWGIYFPCYELNTFETLTGMRAEE